MENDKKCLSIYNEAESSISIIQLSTNFHDWQKNWKTTWNDKKMTFVDSKKNRVFQLFSQLSTNFHNRQTEKVKKITKLQEAFIDLQWNRPRLFQFFSKYILSINFHDRHVWRENLENNKKHSLIQKETEFEYSNYSQNTSTNFDRHT